MMIKINRYIAKIFLLMTNPYQNIIMVCKGYDEDYINYTELVWNDDKYLDFTELCYSDFQLWIQAKTKGVGHGSTSRAF